MTEYEILKKRIEEWNRGKGAEFQLQLGEAKEDYVDPDYGVFKKYGACGLDWGAPFIMFENLQELEEGLEMLQWSYHQEQSDRQERRL
ncbi:MAG: hypothetical protein EOM01_08505 [Spirochaetia bacterium]|nr:hypothetical protein [Spirochaetia bacterium]